MPQILWEMWRMIAMLERNGILKIANVGDCGLRVIREDKIKFSTSPQEHYFDCPYQLSSEIVGQTYQDAMVSNVELMEGDTIVMGSDGLFDNVFDHEIVSTVAGYRDVAEAGMCFQQQCPSLQELEISGCPKLSSFGVKNSRLEEEGEECISLQSTSDLRTMTSLRLLRMLWCFLVASIFLLACCGVFQDAQ